MVSRIRVPRLLGFSRRVAEKNRRIRAVQKPLKPYEPSRSKRARTLLKWRAQKEAAAKALLLWRRVLIEAARAGDLLTAATAEMKVQKYGESVAWFARLQRNWTKASRDRVAYIQKTTREDALAKSSAARILRDRAVFLRRKMLERRRRSDEEEHDEG
ncbi:MAG: hypothetical protein Q7R47_03990 [Candidatus Diapherotrites archaeon]|nr:hypothetical protein [Candidatus Diapherotrites archaeon]